MMSEGPEYVTDQNTLQTQTYGFKWHVSVSEQNSQKREVVRFITWHTTEFV